MSERKTFVLISPRVRGNAFSALREAHDGQVVTIADPTRSNEQNAKLHAMLSDLAKSGFPWAGKTRSLDEWKVLMISAHAVATDHKGEVIPGLEGEFVAIRESSARMSVSRAASLITYVQAFCDMNGIELTETRGGGWLNEVAA